MILADTSIWIEYLKTRAPTFPKMRRNLERGEILAVECVFGELLQGARNSNEVQIIREYFEILPKISETGLWVEAGHYSFSRNLAQKGVGLIDVAILVAARRAKALIWTLDRKFNNILKKGEIYD